MEIIEEGKTVQEAIQKAINKLNTTMDNVKVEVLEKENKGLLKFMGMSKTARVKVQLIKEPDKGELIQEFIQDILKLMQLDSKAEASLNKNQVYVNIKGEEETILLDKGKTLEAFQHICNRKINKNNEDPRVKVNVECAGYRKKQEDNLKRLAQKLADKAKRTGQSQSVNSLSPQNRRIIHITLENNKEIKTYSKGDGFLKTVIIERVNNKNNRFKNKKRNHYKNKSKKSHE